MCVGSLYLNLYMYIYIHVGSTQGGMTNILSLVAALEDMCICILDDPRVCHDLRERETIIRLPHEEFPDEIFGPFADFWSGRKSKVDLDNTAVGFVVSGSFEWRTAVQEFVAQHAQRPYVR